MVTPGPRDSLDVEWQRAWSPPREREAVRVARLPALQRLLLTTDGTMTLALAMLELPPTARAALADGEAPIGSVLRPHEIETFRVPLGLGVRLASEEAAEHLGSDVMCWRRYLIKAERRPLMSVDEQFPAAGFAAGR